jgi:membrane associated rhomboid family serine protease
MEPGTFPYHRITPWVGRLLAIFAGIELLRATIFTSPGVAAALAFDPQAGLTHPWTVLTYGFVHAGLFHLLANSLALFFLGPPVERRLGGPAFLLFFLYCVAGAAAFAMALNTIYPVPPFVGASGGIIGILYAFAHIHPDAELIAFPIPMPIRARTLVTLQAIFDLCGILFLRAYTGMAHEAHLGGLAFGWLFFRMQGMGRKPAAYRPPSPIIEQHAAVGGREVDPPRRSGPTARPPALDKTQAELDRVLDKISATGMKSLTATERQFLDQVARKKADS